MFGGRSTGALPPVAGRPRGWAGGRDDWPEARESPAGGGGSRPAGGRCRAPGDLAAGRLWLSRLPGPDTGQRLRGPAGARPGHGAHPARPAPARSGPPVLTRVRRADYLGSEARRAEALGAVTERGAVLLTGVPPEPGAVLDVTATFGFGQPPRPGPPSAQAEKEGSARRVPRADADVPPASV